MTVITKEKKSKAMAKEPHVQWGLEPETSSKKIGHVATELQSEFG